MKALRPLAVKRWILLLIASLSPGCLGNNGPCSADINADAERCMEPYASQTSAASAKQLFMGVDVEVVRSTCTALSSAVQCAKDLYQRCPESERDQIRDSMSGIHNMFTLCNYPRLYEIYARHMNCYWRNSAYSEKCYEKYRGEIDPVAVEMKDEAALGVMCREYAKLVSCVETNVLLQCNSTEARDLVESLIAPSVTANSHCASFTTDSASRQRAVHPTTDSISDANRQSGHRNTGNGIKYHNAPAVWGLLLLSIITSGISFPQSS